MYVGSIFGFSGAYKFFESVIAGKNFYSPELSETDPDLAFFRLTYSILSLICSFRLMRCSNSLTVKALDPYTLFFWIKLYKYLRYFSASSFFYLISIKVKCYCFYINILRIDSSGKSIKFSSFLIEIA